jgi:hypothetical protein
MALAASCQAHFLWIKTVTVEGKPHGLLFFNEGPADESYHFPEKLAKARLWSRTAEGEPREVATKGIDTDDRVGLIGPLRDENAVVLEASQQYGIYHGALLTYHAKHICGKSAEGINKAGASQELKLEVVPTVKDDKFNLAVLWEGKPLAGAALTIVEGDSDPVETKADDEGRASFTPESEGLIGVLANRNEKDKSGELDGKPYKGVMHYASLTFQVGAKKDAPQKSATNSPPKDGRRAPAEAAILAPLPEPVASFGAAVCDGWLYVYGGHIGGEHEHSAANLSQHFRRIRLDGTGGWQELPMQTPLQGVPLVEYGGKVYRVGGLEIRNPTLDDEEDLHSTAAFAQFDPAKSEWTTLTPLPAGRSSHNAVVIGDKLYVVGGWRLEGKSRGQWEPDALVYDFTNPDEGWQKLRPTGFKRRALAAGVWKGKLVALGGMNESAKVSLRADVFDPQTGKWEKGPRLPGAGMAGFGASAWNLDGNLYVCGLGGVLHRLSKDGSSWEEAGRIATPRFFHQLVPGPDGGLMVVGGASQDGHLASIERVEIQDDRAVTN